MADPETEKDSSLTGVRACWLLVLPMASVNYPNYLPLCNFPNLADYLDYDELPAEADLNPIKVCRRPRTARMEFLCKDLWPGLSTTQMSGIAGVKMYGGILLGIFGHHLGETTYSRAGQALPARTPREILSNFRLLPLHLKRRFWQEC